MIFKYYIYILLFKILLLLFRIKCNVYNMRVQLLYTYLLKINIEGNKESGRYYVECSMMRDNNYVYYCLTHYFFPVSVVDHL